MSTTLIVFTLFTFAVAGLAIWVVSLYNELVRMRNAVDQSWANIDVILKQRHDELPKLVEVCNAYMTHERETLEAVTAARSASLGGRGIGDKTQAENQITAALGHLFAVAESYPQLQANQNFIQLQQRVSAIESQIADRRSSSTTASRSSTRASNKSPMPSSPKSSTTARGHFWKSPKRRPRMWLLTSQIGARPRSRLLKKSICCVLGRRKPNRGPQGHGMQSASETRPPGSPASATPHVRPSTLRVDRPVRRLRQLLTYDPVRSGFLLPAALHLELFEQPAGFTESYNILLASPYSFIEPTEATASPD